MNKLRTSMLVVLGGCVAMAACTGDVSTVGPQHVRGVASSAIEGPYVPAGTRLTVRMNRAIDSLQTIRGEAFTATVEAPLRAADGTVVVPAGAIVRGTVASTGDPAMRRLRLRLESVETTAGPAPIAAAVRHAQRSTYGGPPQLMPVPYETYPAWDNDVSWTGGPGWGWNAPMGGGPIGSLDGYALQNSREIHVARGAQLELQLTRPVVPPGTPLR